MWAGLTYSQVGKIKTEEREGGAARGDKNGVRTEVFGHLHPHMPLCTSTILKKFMHLKFDTNMCLCQFYINTNHQIWARFYNEDRVFAIFIGVSLLSPLLAGAWEVITLTSVISCAIIFTMNDNSDESHRSGSNELFRVKYVKVEFTHISFISLWELKDFFRNSCTDKVELIFLKTSLRAKKKLMVKFVLCSR